MEIEKKFIVKAIPDDLDKYECKYIEQAYLNTDPVIRIRKENENYYLTYKEKGLLAREEYNLPLNEMSYYHLKAKADGNVISKKRFVIPLTSIDYTSQSPPTSINQPADYPTPTLNIELDIFDPPFAPLIIAEVEFPNLEAADNFTPPAWFADEVTMNPEYHNSNLSRRVL